MEVRAETSSGTWKHMSAGPPMSCQSRAALPSLPAVSISTVWGYIEMPGGLGEEVRRSGLPGTSEGLLQFILERGIGLSSYCVTFPLILVLQDSFLLMLVKCWLSPSIGWNVRV